MKFPEPKKDPQLEALLKKLIEEDKLRHEKEKLRYHFKTYINLDRSKGRRSPEFGYLLDYPDHKHLMGAPLVIEEWWMDSDQMPHASVLGAGDCMHCYYIPEALRTLAEAIEEWVKK